jgi:hypothetical protein
MFIKIYPQVCKIKKDKYLQTEDWKYVSQDFDGRYCYVVGLEITFYFCSSVLSKFSIMNTQVNIVKRWVINKLIYINIIYLSPTHHLTVLKTNTQKYWQWLSFGYGIESIFIFLNFSFISSNDEAKKCSHFFNAQNYCFFGKLYILLWRNSYCYIFLLLFYFCFSLFLVVFAFYSIFTNQSA